MSSKTTCSRRCVLSLAALGITLVLLSIEYVVNPVKLLSVFGPLASTLVDHGTIVIGGRRNIDDSRSINKSNISDNSSTVTIAIGHSNSKKKKNKKGRKIKTTEIINTTDDYLNVSRDFNSLFYKSVDVFERWSQKGEYALTQRPRVLILCWCTDDTHVRFVNSIYWLSCYAHSHGFAIRFTSEINFGGVKKMTYDSFRGNEVGDLGWYADEHMWAWVAALRNHLFSGKYDYVFQVGIDTLPNGINMHFPVWAYDKGHDITIMDQDYGPLGLNENSMLFKPTNFTRMFLDELFEFRKGFYIQGDNGPWMEMILRTIGRENEENGNRSKYWGNCLPLLDLGEYSAAYLNEKDMNLMKLKSIKYSECFFNALDIIAGGYGHRKSQHIGFSETYIEDGPKNVKVYVDVPDILTPWANCYNIIRLQKYPAQPDMPGKNCLFMHYNGPKGKVFKRIRGGRCEDPKFGWKAWKYNPDPRRNFFR